MAYTTIQITPRTRNRLETLKGFRRETYEEVVSRLLDLVPEGDEEGAYRPEFRASVLRGMLDIKNGRVTPHAQLKKRLGLK
ncbi:MAG: hypothetical protein NT157_03420 [Candidatus Micrarchaeota archaeon]|nr:hypothetical protein [Candidatus Micrarchaeota archaeon]